MKNLLIIFIVLFAAGCGVGSVEEPIIIEAVSNESNNKIVYDLKLNNEIPTYVYFDTLNADTIIKPLNAILFKKRKLSHPLNLKIENVELMLEGVFSQDSINLSDLNFTYLDTIVTCNYHMIFPIKTFSIQSKVDSLSLIINSKRNKITLYKGYKYIRVIFIEDVLSIIYSNDKPTYK